MYLEADFGNRTRRAGPHRLTELFLVDDPADICQEVSQQNRLTRRQKADAAVAPDQTLKDVYLQFAVDITGGPLRPPSRRDSAARPRDVVKTSGELARRHGHRKTLRRAGAKCANSIAASPVPDEDDQQRLRRLAQLRAQPPRIKLDVRGRGVEDDCVDALAHDRLPNLRARKRRPEMMAGIG